MTRTHSAARRVLALIAIAIQALAFFCIDGPLEYGQMASVATAQLWLFIAILALMPPKQSFNMLFLVVTWIFYCGHLICIACGYNDLINLDFRLYASSSIAMDAFRFYFFSQTLIIVGMLTISKKQTLSYSSPSRSQLIQATPFVGVSMLLCGLPFRLYIDASRTIAALTLGYKGVGALGIPTVIQAMAFFFEAGALLLLLLYGRQRKGTVLFWLVLVFKVATMATGARQDAFCFLIVWCLIYFIYIRKVTPARCILAVLGGVCLIYAIDAFGELRANGFSVEAFEAYATNSSVLSVVGDSFSEFGSTFSTLAVAMKDVPGLLGFGMGKSYIAGLFSIIPGMVGNFPDLKTASVFVTALPETWSFGGSMLGEFYYNFGWWGLAGSFLVGCIVAMCQTGFSAIGNHGSILHAWISAFVAIFLLLFIRGYFTDMMMKLAYTVIFAWILTSVERNLPRRVAKRRGMEIEEHAE